MTNTLKSFVNNESGAIQPEWVVIVAATVGLTIAVLSYLAPGIGNLAVKNANVLAIED